MEEGKHQSGCRNAQGQEAMYLESKLSSIGICWDDLVSKCFKLDTASGDTHQPRTRTIRSLGWGDASLNCMRRVGTEALSRTVRSAPSPAPCREGRRFRTTTAGPYVDRSEERRGRKARKVLAPERILRVDLRIQGPGCGLGLVKDLTHDRTEFGDGNKRKRNFL